MYTFPAPDFLHITYRTDLEFLVVRWQRPVSGAEVRQGYQLILAAAQHCRCPYWLLDGRRRLPADEETTRWGLEEFFPRLAGLLGQSVYMSQLLSPSYQQITNGSAAFHALDHDAARTYHMRRFNDETTAVQWLQQEQARR